MPEIPRDAEVPDRQGLARRHGLTPRDRVLATAARLFQEEGIQSVGMNRVASEAGVAPMTIYRHFHNKERLVAVVIEDRSSRSLRWLAERLDPPGEGRQASLEGLWEVLQEWLAADELHASLLTSVASELRSQVDHPAHKAVEAHRTAMRQLLEEDLAGRAEAVDPPRLAGQLLFLVEGAAVVEVDADDLRALADAALVAVAARRPDA
jgi:AcrR family transcriptional regulator